MKNGIGVSIIWATLAFAPLSDLKAGNLEKDNNSISLWKTVKSELFQSLNNDNFNQIDLQLTEQSEIVSPVSRGIVVNAALSYFDEEVKLYSLKWEAREKVKTILMDYLSAHPILKKTSNWEILFIIDNKPEFASMIKNLANTLFDGMPKIIRDIAVLIAFWWNEELQNTLNNLDYTVMNLPIKQYKDIVFDYFWWIVKRVASSLGFKITVGDYYTKVHEYYPNKNHDRILKELEKTWQIDDNIVDLRYPFKK